MIADGNQNIFWINWDPWKVLDLGTWTGFSYIGTFRDLVVHKKLAKCSSLNKQWRGIPCPRKTLHSHTFLLLVLQLISIIIVNNNNALSYHEEGWGGLEWAVTLLECGWEDGGCSLLLFLQILMLLCVRSVVWCGCSTLFLCVFPFREWEIYLWVICICFIFLPKVIVLCFIQMSQSLFAPLSCDTSFSFFKCCPQILSFSLSNSLEWQKSYPYCLLPF